jgi:DNA polymerase elongation subunit (family B)
MLQFDCFPATDELQIFRHLLTDLRNFRLEAKARMRAERDPGRQHHLQALQNTFKILLNSFYGYLGFAQGHFARLRRRRACNADRARSVEEDDRLA